MIFPTFFHWLGQRRRQRTPASWSVVLEHLNADGLQIRVALTDQVQAALPTFATNGQKPRWQGRLPNLDVLEQVHTSVLEKAQRKATETENTAFEILTEATETAAAEDAHTTEQSHPTLFVFDVAFLRRSAQFILAEDRQVRRSLSPKHATGAVRVHDDFKEVFHYATGVRVNHYTYVITQIVPVAFAQQSATGVKVESSSNILALANLDTIGLPLIAHFHSHPGNGPEGTHPSGTDRRFQDTLERGGHIAIGGIFSRDGFLRFFAGNPDRMAIEIQGKQVERYDDLVFKIPLADSATTVEFGPK